MNFVKVTRNGQVTIPKRFRDKFKTDYYVCEIEADEVLFRPVEVKKAGKQKSEVVFYQTSPENFGLYFPEGIEAGKLLKKLKEADGELS